MQSIYNRESTGRYWNIIPLKGPLWVGRMSSLVGICLQVVSCALEINTHWSTQILQ
jgi:hypothetical protein